MNGNEISALVSILVLVILSRSIYLHYIIKDGWARIMLLFMSSILWLFLLVRIVNVMCMQFGLITHSQFTANAYWNVYLIYSIVIGQFYLQARRK